MGADDRGNVRAAPVAVVPTAGEKVLAGVPAIETRSLLRTRRWVTLPLQTPVTAAITPADSDALLGGLIVSQ